MASMFKATKYIMMGRIGIFLLWLSLDSIVYWTELESIVSPSLSLCPSVLQSCEQCGRCQSRINVLPRASERASNSTMAVVVGTFLQSGARNFKPRVSEWR